MIEEHDSAVDRLPKDIEGRAPNCRLTTRQQRLAARDVTSGATWGTSVTGG